MLEWLVHPAKELTSGANIFYSCHSTAEVEKLSPLIDAPRKVPNFPFLVIFKFFITSSRPLLSDRRTLSSIAQHVTHRPPIRRVHFHCQTGRVCSQQICFIFFLLLNCRIPVYWANIRSSRLLLSGFSPAFLGRNYVHSVCKRGLVKEIYSLSIAGIFFERKILVIIFSPFGADYYIHLRHTSHSCFQFVHIVSAINKPAANSFPPERSLIVNLDP